jgi:SAM-dependent methyltransferase
MKSDRCRACGAAELALVHDFGPQPLAGTYPLVAESVSPAKRYPLDLTQCRACGLLQVTNLPPIDEVFHDDYRYSSSTVPGLVRHFDDYADWLSARLPSGGRVLEFGCNDGVLLERLGKRGYDCTGVDASDNMAEIARGKGIDVITGFLTPDIVVEHGLAGQFDAVTCSNVFAHIHNIAETAAAVRLLLKPGGLFFVEVHDGDVLAREAQFDTIYHEHLSYFTESTLRRFASREMFSFVECARTPMHGGSLRFCGRHTDIVDDEEPMSASEMVDSSRFSETISRCASDVRRLYDKHGPLQGYGAAGRAQMFVNMTNTGACFSAVFDDSPFRQGRYIVATEVPILPWGGDEGACCGILAWNYAPGIAERIRDKFKEVVTLLPEYQRW